MLISLLFGRYVIGALKNWNIGQQIREEGPQAHIAKRDTPTMGGLLVIASVIISTLLWARLSSFYVWIIVFATLAFGAVGFADDYMKLVKRRSLGLTGRQKLALQLADRGAASGWRCLFRRNTLRPSIRGTSAFHSSKKPRSRPASATSGRGSIWC